MKRDPVALVYAGILALGSQLDGILTYNKGLREAARKVGIRPAPIGE